MKNNIICLLLFFSSYPLFAQQLEFSGYFENQLFPQSVKGKMKIMDYNKLRLDLSSQISEQVSFNANYIYKTFHGYTSLNGLDFLPEALVQTYSSLLNISPDSLRPMFNMEMKDENFLDNTYVSIYTDDFNVRIGKQQLPWGSGYTWNPTDIFHGKDMTDPTYEKTGINALKVEVPLGLNGMVTGVFSVNDEFKTSTKALRFKQIVSNFDFALCYAEKYVNSLDYFTFSSSAILQKMIGGNFSTELFGLGVWGEGAYNIMSNEKNYGQYLLGFDYTFENELYLMVEYYRNELGKVKRQDYDLNDWMRLLGAQGENLGRDYVFVGQRYPITEFINWSNYSIINMNDGSLMFFPWFDYSMNDNTEIHLVGYIPFGEMGSEFGEFGAGGFARIRVYF